MSAGKHNPHCSTELQEADDEDSDTLKKINHVSNNMDNAELPVYANTDRSCQDEKNASTILWLVYEGLQID